MEVLKNYMESFDLTEAARRARLGYRAPVIDRSYLPRWWKKLDAESFRSLLKPSRTLSRHFVGHGALIEVRHPFSRTKALRDKAYRACLYAAWRVERNNRDLEAIDVEMYEVIYDTAYVRVWTKLRGDVAHGPTITERVLFEWEPEVVEYHDD